MKIIRYLNESTEVNPYGFHVLLVQSKWLINSVSQRLCVHLLNP